MSTWYYLTCKWQPTPVFLPGKSYVWRSLVGYSQSVGSQSQTRLSDFTFIFTFKELLSSRKWPGVGDHKGHLSLLKGPPQRGRWKAVALFGGTLKSELQSSVRERAVSVCMPHVCEL